MKTIASATGVAALSAAAGTATAAVLLAAAGTAGISPEVLLRDPAQQFGFPVYAGFVSAVGVFALIATGAMAALAATLARADRTILATVAALSVFMAFDDHFVFHERIATVHLGLSSKLVMAAYALVALWLFSRPAVRHGPAGAGGLVLAGALLALSGAIDLFLPYSVPALVAEDLAKLGGYAAWLAHWGRFAQASVAASQREGGIEYVSEARATGSAVPSE